MDNGPLKNIVLIVMSLACVACALGIGFVLFDVTLSATGSAINGYGVVAIFGMTLAMAGRWVWQKRQID